MRLFTPQPPYTTFAGARCCQCRAEFSIELVSLGTAVASIKLASQKNCKMWNKYHHFDRQHITLNAVFPQVLGPGVATGNRGWWPLPWAKWENEAVPPLLDFLRPQAVFQTFKRHPFTWHYCSKIVVHGWRRKLLHVWARIQIYCEEVIF